jgi:hypothetical protein
MFHRLARCDKSDFILFENEDHVISWLEPECFSILYRNDDSATMVEMGLA